MHEPKNKLDNMDVEKRLLRLIERQNTQRKCLEKLTSVVIELINEDDFAVDPTYRDITLEWDGSVRAESTGADGCLTPHSPSDASHNISYWHDLWRNVPEILTAINKCENEPLVIVTADETLFHAQRLDEDWLENLIDESWATQKALGHTREVVRRTGETPAYLEEHEVSIMHGSH